MSTSALNAGWGTLYAIVYIGAIAFALRMALTERNGRRD